MNATPPHTHALAAWAAYASTAPAAPAPRTLAAWNEYATATHATAPVALSSADPPNWFAHSRAHEAGTTDRHNVDQTRQAFSADSANLPDFGTVNSRVRDARRNDWLGETIPATASRRAIGNGITPRAQPRDAKRKRRDDLADQMDFWFRHWAQAPVFCDIEGKKTLRDITRLSVEERVIAGGCFIITSYLPRRDMVGLVLQMFEPEQLADDVDCKPHPGNSVRAGIEIDKFGRAQAYWVYTDQHPLDTVGHFNRPDRKPQRIPADRVLHYQRQKRVRETLTVSDLGCILRQHWQFRGYNQNEVAAKNKESHLAYIIEQNPELGGIAEPGNINTDEFDENDRVVASQDGNAAAYRYLRWEPGVVPILNAGESLKLLDPRRPGTTYDPFIHRNINMIAAAQGYGYPTLSRDYRGASYASLRMNQVDDWETTDVEQAGVIDYILRPTWQRFHDLAFMEGRYAAPDRYLLDPAERLRTLEADWGIPPRRQIDLAKHAAGIKILRSLDLYNDADWAGERNEDWRTNLQESAEIVAYRKYLGLPPEPIGAMAPGSQGGPGTPAGGGDPSRQPGKADLSEAVRNIAAAQIDPTLALALQDPDRLTRAQLIALITAEAASY